MPTVLLTRPENRTSAADDFHRILKDHGVELSELPMIRFSLPKDTTAIDRSLAELAKGKFDYVILSSPTAVEFFHERLKELELSVNGTKFGAVGEATAAVLEALGYNVKLPVPAAAGASSLVALLSAGDMVMKRVLVLQSQIGLEEIEYALEQAGAVPKRVTLYETKGPSLADSARLVTLLESSTRPDVIAFFSPSSVSYFIRTLAEMSSGLLRSLPAIACIGETTAKAVEEALRRRPEIVARKADQMSLAQDILTYLKIA
jgi:uroporphyrinogen-III synthase